ncbi:MAG: hypothetical protein JWP75_286 [Frondihabitans sp.]|nr:hypothetical protein [Frondihabitans sp.]
MDELSEQLSAVGVHEFTARHYRPGVVRHIVLFRLRADATPADRLEVVRQLTSLQGSLRHDGEPYIVDIVAGSQSSGEGAGHDFELGFIVTFASEGDRNFYVGEPIVSDPACFDHEHAAFKRFVGPLLAPGAEGVLVFDFADPDDSGV